jgi:hypothetical protein
MEHVLQHEKHAETRHSSRHAGPSLDPAAPQQLGLQLQQQAGNQAVQEFLRAGVIRAKFAVSSPGDAEEQEAEAAAGQIMRSHSGAGASITPCSCGDDEETMCDECRHNAIARRASDSSAVRSPSPSVVSQMMRSPGHALDGGTRAFFEPRFQRDLSGVRIHTDSHAAESAAALRAHAYTLGNDIWFGAGKYAPDSHDGRHLLAHEMAHTFQQQASTPDASSLLRRSAVTVGRHDDPLEAEAEHVADSVMHSPAPARIRADHSPAIRGSWYGAAASWVGGKIEDAGSASLDAAEWAGGKAVAAGEWVGDKTVAAGEWVGDKAVAAGEWVGDKAEAAGEWAGDKAKAAGKWAVNKLENAWGCMKSLGKGASNVVTGNISSLADILGIDAPTAADPSTLDTLVSVLKHPCLQMLPGYGLVSGAVGILEKVGKFLIGAWHLIQNPQPVIDGIQNAISKMIAAIPGYIQGVVDKALSTLGSKLKEHGKGVWRHLEPKLEYLAKNWWQVIKDTGWQLLWPWPSVGKDLGKVWDSLKSAANNLWHLRFSKAIDDILAVERGVNSILGSLYGWFFIASVLVGAILGGIFGVGAGAIPGAAAGAAFAGEVGEGLLIATVAIESASILKSVYNLLAQTETKQEKEDDYEQIASSSLTLAITGVMFLLSELAVKFAQGILEKAANLVRKIGGSEVEDAASAAAKTVKGETTTTEAPTTDTAPADAKAGEPPDKAAVDAETLGEGFDPVTGEPVEPLPDGEARVTEDGRCEICHSPCKFTDNILRELREKMQSVRDVSGEVSGPRLAQLDNVLRRLQVLEDAMGASAREGKLKAEFNAKFRDSFEQLSFEADTAYADIFGSGETSYDPFGEIESRSPNEPGSVFDDPKSRWDPEKANVGTAFHDLIEGAVVNDLPPGSALTENTIQDFFGERNIKGPGIPKRSSGIDLYILDRVNGTATPVDITNVAGDVGHVNKLGRNFEGLREPFAKAGFTLENPIEIEYVGQNFDEAAERIVNELRALAR